MSISSVPGRSSELMLDLSLMLSSMNDTSFNDAMMPAPPARVKPGRTLALRRRFVHLEEYAAGRSNAGSTLGRVGDAAVPVAVGIVAGSGDHAAQRHRGSGPARFAGRASNRRRMKRTERLKRDRRSRAGLKTCATTICRSSRRPFVARPFRAARDRGTKDLRYDHLSQLTSTFRSAALQGCS